MRATVNGKTRLLLVKSGGSYLSSGDARLTVIPPDGRHDVLTVKVTGQPGYLSDELGRALQFVFPQAGLYRVHLTTDGRCGEGCAQQEVTIQ